MARNFSNFASSTEAQKLSIITPDEVLKQDGQKWTSASFYRFRVNRFLSYRLTIPNTVCSIYSSSNLETVFLPVINGSTKRTAAKIRKASERGRDTKVEKSP